MNDPQCDPIVGKIVIDFSRKYVSLYLCEGDGVIKDFDHFRYPFRLDTKDAKDETVDTFHFLFQYLNESMNPELQEDDDSAADSKDGGAA